MNDRALNQRVGLFVLAALALAVAALGALSGRMLGPVDEIHVRFARIGGLKAGAPVRLSGQEVGRVRSIWFAPGGQLSVDLSVRRRYRAALHAGNEFYIGVGATLLSDPTLDIGPPRGDPGPVLPAGAVVRGIDPPSLDRVLARVYDNLRTLTDAFREQRAEIDDFLRSVDHLLVTAGGVEVEPGAFGRIRDGITAGTVAGLDLIAALRAGTEDGVRLRAAAREAGRLWTRAERDLARIRPRLARAVAGIDRLADVFSPEQRGRIRGALAALDRAATVGQAVAHEIARLSDWVASGRGTVGALMRDLELVDDIKEINRMLQNRPWLGLGRPDRRRRE